jgi:hypothetical protein
MLMLLNLRYCDFEINERCRKRTRLLICPFKASFKLSGRFKTENHKKKVQDARLLGIFSAFHLRVNLDILRWFYFRQWLMIINMTLCAEGVKAHEGQTGLLGSTIFRLVLIFVTSNWACWKKKFIKPRSLRTAQNQWETSFYLAKKKILSFECEYSLQFTLSFKQQVMSAVKPRWWWWRRPKPLKRSGQGQREASRPRCRSRAGQSTLESELLHPAGPRVESLDRVHPKRRLRSESPATLLQELKRYKETNKQTNK